MHYIKIWKILYATIYQNEYKIQVVGRHLDRKTAKEDKHINGLYPIYINDEGKLRCGLLFRNSSFMKR